MATTDPAARDHINDLLSQLACCADFMNTWARELGVEEVRDPSVDLELRNLADRLWLAMGLRHRREIAKDEALLKDCGYLIYKLAKRCPNPTLAANALDFLKRKERLHGSILRRELSDV